MQKDEFVTTSEDKFSLGNSANLILFNEILDSLIKVMNEDERKFKFMFMNLPLSTYMKIDALRNIFLKDKSSQFIDVVNKAKLISNKFHNNFK